MNHFRLRRRGGPRGSAEDAASADGFEESVGDRVSPGKGAGCGVAFFGVFLLFGLGFSAFFVRSAIQVLEARSWTEVSCEILESRVASHAGEDGSTYSVEVRYRYTVDGREHTSDRYQFLGGSSSGYEGKARVVERLPPGTRTICYVDPEDPAEAVLVRRFTAGYLFVLLPLVFVAVGAGGMIMSRVAVKRAKTRRESGRPEWLPEPDGEPAFEGPAGGLSFPAPSGGSAPLVLEARMSPLGKLAGVTVIALFWNGIVGVFVWQVWESWRAGSPDGCLTIFILPFVLIGLLLLAGVPYQFLALFNPRPRVTLTPGRLALGDSAELAWRFLGRPGRIRRLRITLEGTEEADVRKGDSTRTPKETFAAYDLLDTSLPMEIAGGSTRVSIPADTMHTFDAPDHRIHWTLKVHGAIRLWPDVAEEIRVVVHPRPLGEGSR